jgi:putative transposase
MARALRLNRPGAWHHVMNRGSRHRIIFRNDEDRADFLQLLGDIARRYGLQINAFCLMGTHYHLLVKDPEGQLSRAIRHLDGVYAQRFNKRHGLDGPLFKDRYLSKLVDTDGYLHHVARYVHRNPLEASVVEELLSYRWSSYPLLVGPTKQRPEWLSDEAVVAAGSSTGAELRRFTEGAVDDGIDVEEYGVVVGSDRFISAVLALAKSDDQTLGHIRRAAIRPTADQIEQTTDRVLSRYFAGISGPGERRLKLVSLGLCQELAGMPLEQLAERYGYASAQSAGSATHRFRCLIEDPKWQLAVECVRKELEGIVVDERCR